MAELLCVKDLTKVYGKRGAVTRALDGVDLSLEAGEYVGIMGASGSGKTTLLNCISCYTPADSGSILLDGVELARLKEDELAGVRNRKLGFVFQDFLLLDGLSVRENILLPAILSGRINSTAEARADQLCDVFGIGGIRNKYPAEISGGEKQRTAVARALINHPLLVLADEPTGNLDSKTSQDVLSLMKITSQKFAQTMVMITHNEEIAQLADRIVRIEDGRIRGKGGEADA